MNKKTVLLLFALGFLFLALPKKAFAAYCGMFGCEVGEDCSNCPADCGVCPTSAPPPPSQCTFALCGILAGCDCYQNPQVCLACPGAVKCGEKTCPNGTVVWTMCTPDCTSLPRTCYDSPTCDPPPNCNNVGGDSYCQGLVIPGSCGGTPACTGVGKCAAGGNCYTDCTGCSSPKHWTCQGCSCNLVDGAGSNTCTHSADCCNHHHECQNSACVEVSGAGNNACTNNIDCSNAPTCTITGPSSLTVGGVGGSYTATATGHGGTVRRIEVWRAQENYMAQDRPATGWRLIGSAATNASGLTSTTQSWSAISSDLTGYNGNRWWVVCNAYYNINGFVAGNRTQQCTGSPWDPFTSWSDCWLGNGTDSKEVQVNAVPTPTPTPTCATPVAPQCGSATVDEGDVTLTWGDSSNWNDLCDPLSPSSRRYRVYNSTSYPPEPGNLIGDFLYGTPNFTSRSMTLTDQPEADYYWGVKASNLLFTSTMSSVCQYSVVYTRDPWWQTKDGDIHAEGGITSIIPDCATDNYLSKVGDGGSPGVVSWGGTVEPSLGTGSISVPEWQANTAYNGGDMKFDYLVNRLNVDTSSDTFTGTMPVTSETYYSSSGRTLSGNFPVGSKIVIFVNGDVTVSNDIVVPVGGFFALISKGNITFTDTVTRADGFYLADGVVTVAAGTSAFAGQGSFVGWGGFSFNRSLSSNCSPATNLVSRPDLYLNAPSEFQFAPFVFQEVAP